MKVREASDEVMSAIVRETWPDTQEEEMSEAMSRIDTSDLRVGATDNGYSLPTARKQLLLPGSRKEGPGGPEDHSRISTKGSLDQQ